MTQLMLMLMVAVLVVIAPAGGLSADDPDEQWNKTFGGAAGDYAYSVQQTSDGGFILAGTTHSYGTGFDAWLIKTDANGFEQWNRTYGGPANAYSVQQTSDGGYILAGILYSDGLLIKTDENGNEQWKKIFKGKLVESVRQTSDGGFILAANTVLSPVVPVWLIKTDANGNEQWSRTLGPGFVNSVQQTSEGGFALAGYKGSYWADAWLIKTDISGNEQWNKTFGGIREERAHSLQQTSDGGFILAGYTGSYAAGYFDSWLIKTDINGNEQWNKTFGGEYYDMANSVQQTSDGGFILAGSTNSFGTERPDAWLIKTDLNGNEQWNITLGGTETDWAESVQQTSDGGFVLAGNTYSYGTVNGDAWLIKVGEETAEFRVHNINKGTDYTTIQAAIDDASPGDEIRVDSGTYVENVDVYKQLTLIGEGADVVTVLAANAADHVFEVTADWVNISGFTMTGATATYFGAGIQLSNVNHCNILDNTASDNFYGIYLDSSSSNTLQSNIASSNYVGIFFNSSNNNTLTNNNASSNSGTGITIGNSSSNTLTNNTASSNTGTGISISYSSSNTINNNIASSNSYGFGLFSSSNNNTLTNNNASLNYYGIYLSYFSDNNTLTNNIASNNNYGIYLCSSSNYNTIYHNNLIDNTQNAYDSGTNQWDSGSEGNYWSDYTGNDTNKDGIGDYPYDIPGGTSVDRYPLTGIRWLPPEITRSRLGINAHWNHWAEDLSVYKQKTISFGIVRDQAWWAGLETSDLTGSEWDYANWDYLYSTETLCGKEITYQSGLDNLVKLYQDEDSPELLLLLNLKNDNISPFETITADQYYDYVYHVVERYDGDGLDDMPGLIRPVRYFEVGNEVDYIRTNDSRHGYLSPKDYIEKRLIPAYNAAKAANKEIVIMGSGLGMGSDIYGNDGQEFNTMYLDAMYDNITKNGGDKNNNFYMDKIAIHYYAKPNIEFDKNIKKVEDVIHKYENRDKPIWITEFYPLTEIGSVDTTTGAFVRLLTIMFANKIEMPVIYNLKDDSKESESYGLYNVTCEGDEETITPRESIQVIDTVLSTLHSTTSSEAENISIEPGKTTYKRVFNNSEKTATVLWYIDDANPGAVTNHVIFPELPQTFTVDVLGTANFSHASPINLKIGSEPTYVVEANLPICVDMYFNKTTTAGVSTEKETSFRVGDTLYGKIKTSTSTEHIVNTYITITMPNGACRYAYYDKPDFTPGNDNLLFSDKKVSLYGGVWNATTNDWLWNIYEFTGGDSGIYAWNCWYEDSETGEILGGNSTEYTYSTTPSGTPVDSSTGKGEVYLDSSVGMLENIVAISPEDMPTVPENLNPIYGFFSFNVTGISGGQSVNIPLAFPDNVPEGTEYWKYGSTLDNTTPHWYQIPISDDDGDRIIVITLTDGGIGDDDLTVNSVIIDDGGPSLPLTIDIKPPFSITNLHSTAGTTWLNWTWTNPSDPDFNHTEIYLNGTFLTNIPAPQNYYNVTGLLPDTSYELSTRTVDTSGNINETWVNDTAMTLDTPPVSNASGPYTGIEGQAIIFNASASYDPDPGDNIVSFEWDFNNDEATDATGMEATWTWNDDYAGQVNLTVTDSHGESSTDITSVTILNTPPDVEAGNDQTVNEGDTVSFTGDFTDPGTGDTHTIEWDFGDGTPGSTGTLEPTHVYADNRTYTITLTVTDDDGASTSDTLNMTVENVAPIVDAGVDQIADEGDIVSFAGNFTDPGTADTHLIEWDFGDATPISSGTLTPTHTYADNGTYAVNLTVIDDDGASTLDTLIVTVNNVVPVLDECADKTVQWGDTMTFSRSFTDPGDDSWTAEIDWGDGSQEEGTLSSKTITATHVYSIPGEYICTLTVLDDDGGVGSGDMQITVTTRATELEYIGDLSAQYSDYIDLKAQLNDPVNNNPLPDRSINFILGTQTATATTGPDGIATTSFKLDQPAGSYDIKAEFDGGDSYSPDNDTEAMQISRENAEITYTGDTILPTTAGSIDLRATLEEIDTEYGDLTEINVNFNIYKSSDLSYSDPVATIPSIASISVTSSGMGVGTATATIDNLPEDDYMIIARIVPNNYYLSISSNPTPMIVYEPTDQFTTGGGWIWDPTGSHGNFGFNVRYNKNGKVKGNSIYVYRLDRLDYIVKSNAWTGLAISDNTSTFQGKAVLQIFDPVTGELQPESSGNFQFTVGAMDNELNGNPDYYKITVLDKDGLEYHNATGSLEGGNIVIHDKKSK